MISRLGRAAASRWRTSRHVRARRRAHQKIGCGRRRGSDIGPRPLDRREHVGRRGERPNALGDRSDACLLVSDLRIVAQPGDSKPIEIGTVHRDGLRPCEIVDRSLDEIPGLQSTRPWLRTDEKDGRQRLAVRFAPVGEADDRWGDVRNPWNRQCPKPLAAVQQCSRLEALGLGGRDPEVGLGVIDHGRHHAFKPQKQPKLHGKQNDGEDDPDQRSDQSNAVVKQIARRKRESNRCKSTNLHRMSLGEQSAQQHDQPTVVHISRVAVRRVSVLEPLWLHDCWNDKIFARAVGRPTPPQ